jgi:two-component system, chemotaxis family, chemotaxis protein CheY
MFNILIVDDMEIVRLMMSILLEQQGYTVTEAENGKIALSILKINANFDLIITNIQMPVMSGIALLKQLKHFYAQIPVLVVSGYSEQSVIVAIRQQNFYLEKPFSRDQLLEAVKRFKHE